MFHQPGLRSIWEKYYEEAHAVIYVIDAACPSRFEDSKTALGNRGNRFLKMQYLEYLLMLLLYC